MAVSSGTLAPPGEYNWNCVHWHHLTNTIELVLPSAHPSPQPKWQINRFSCFCTAHGRKSLYFTMGDPFPKNCPFPWGGEYEPPSNTWFSGPIKVHNPKGISTDSAVFAQTTAECPNTLQWDTPSPLKIAPSHGGSGPHLIHGSLGPPESSTQTASQLLQAFSQGSLVWQTDRPTDRPRYSVGKNSASMYVVRAMRSKNKTS